MAGNQVIYLEVYINKLSVQLGNDHFEVEACVLSKPAQNLLLGNNFLQDTKQFYLGMENLLILMNDGIFCVKKIEKVYRNDKHCQNDRPNKIFLKAKCNNIIKADSEEIVEEENLEDCGVLIDNNAVLMGEG